MIATRSTRTRGRTARAPDARALRKSVVARVTASSAGTVLRPEHLAVRRPGPGIPADRLSDLLVRRGCAATIAPMSLIRFEDLEPTSNEATEGLRRRHRAAELQPHQDGAARDRAAPGPRAAAGGRGLGAARSLRQRGPHSSRRTASRSPRESTACSRARTRPRWPRPPASGCSSWPRSSTTCGPTSSSPSPTATRRCRPRWPPPT